MFPGPPNYESIRKGDQKETAVLLTLARSLCTTGNDPVDIPENGVREVQLVITGDADWAAVHRLRGKRAVVTGILFHAITGHHRTKALLTVSSIRAASP